MLEEGTETLATLRITSFSYSQLIDWVPRRQQVVSKWGCRLDHSADDLEKGGDVVLWRKSRLLSAWMMDPSGAMVQKPISTASPKV
jgi:hypothetical protein